MKILACALLILFGASVAKTQEVPLGKDFTFLGSTANAGVRPFGGYGHQFANNLYSFTQITGTRLNRKPFNIETVITTGICEVRPLGEYVVLGGCLEDGPAMAGTNVGNVMGGTPFLAYRFGKSHWAVAAGGDIFHSSLVNTSKVQTKVFLAVVLDWNRPSLVPSLKK